MVGVIDGFRWAIIGGHEPFYVVGFLESVAVSLALLWFGIWYFRHTERGFADYI